MLLFDYIIPLLVIWLIVRQVIVPILIGTKLFPMFSKKADAVRDEVLTVDEEIAAEEQRHRLKEKQEQLSTLKQGDA